MTPGYVSRIQPHTAHIDHLKPRFLAGLGDVLSLFYDEVQVVRYLPLMDTIDGLTLPGPLLNDWESPTFTAPGLLDPAPALLLFRTAHTETPSFTVSLNNHNLTDYQFVESGPVSWHEIIPAGWLLAENNELIFEVNPSGTVTFSDAVILSTHGA